VHEQPGDFFIREAEGVEHDGPVNAVRGHEDILADDVGVGGPEVLETRQAVAAIGKVTGKGDVVDERVKPDVGDVAGIEGQLDAPGEPLLGTGDREVAGELAHGVEEFRVAEAGEDELRVGLDEARSQSR
jgi:hypothetical protein